MVPLSPSIPLPTIIFQGACSDLRLNTKGSLKPVSFPRPVGGCSTTGSCCFSHTVNPVSPAHMLSKQVSSQQILTDISLLFQEMQGRVVLGSHQGHSELHIDIRFVPDPDRAPQKAEQCCFPFHATCTITTNLFTNNRQSQHWPNRAGY